eukprot:713819_1
MDNANEFKIVVLGGGGVGKSALTIRLVTDNFLEEYDPTIEDSYRKSVVIDDTPILLDILDTAGQEEFSSMQDQWLRAGDGFLLVYSITSRHTFDEVMILRDKILRCRDDDDTDSIPIVVAGNKCDLEEQRQIAALEGKHFCKDINAPFYETSAKDKINNVECFYQIYREYRKKQMKTSDTKPSRGLKINLSFLKPKKKKAISQKDDTQMDTQRVMKQNEDHNLNINIAVIGAHKVGKHSLVRSTLRRPGDSCAGGAGGNGIAFECKRMILRNSHINISGAEGSRMWWSGDGEGGACLIRCDELEMDDNSTIEKGRVVVQINPKTKSNIRYLVRGYFRTHFDCNIADICDLCMSYFALPSYLELNKRIKEATFVDSEWNAFSPEQLVKEAITILKPGLKIKFAFKDDINDIHDWRKMRHYWLNLNAYERGELTANVMRNAIQNVMKKIGITLDCNGMDLDWLFSVIVWSKTYEGYAKYTCLELDIWNKLKLRDFDHSDRIVLLCQSTKTLKMLQNKDSI